jgi:NhaP-type Na+/H+ or K+/H+ antiporter
MLTFETILALLLGATVLAGFARRLSIPYPSLLALGGVLIALLPGSPRLELPPDLILALFVAPVLLDAAYDTSLRDLRRNWLAILGLGSLIADCGIENPPLSPIYHLYGWCRDGGNGQQCPRTSAQDVG